MPLELTLIQVMALTRRLGSLLPKGFAPSVDNKGETLQIKALGDTDKVILSRDFKTMPTDADVVAFAKAVVLLKDEKT